MVVIVKDFTWMQTSETVVVRVPLKGVAPSKVDVFTTDIYIKANYKPFLFEAFLSNSVDEAESSCTITDGEIVFNLRKSQIGVYWDILCADLNQQEKRDLREEISKDAHDRALLVKKRKQEMLQTLQRTAVQQQIDMETDEHKKINDLRNAERDKAMQELDEWKSANHRHEAFVGSTSTAISLLSEAGENEDGGTSTACVSEDSEDDDVWRGDELSVGPEMHSDSSIQLTEDDLRPVPLPRTSCSISVSFTPRAFPTPCRESRQNEEQVWLTKQAEARRATGFIAEDLRPEECDPQWLKEKGDSFYQLGNYLGAVSAYSHGIKLSSKMAALYVNRSAAHFALGNLQRVVEDCSQALELMVPRIKLNEESRARCHARRGAALCQLGMLPPGLADLEEALLIQPNDEKLQQDIERLRSRMNENNSTEDDSD